MKNPDFHELIREFLNQFSKSTCTFSEQDLRIFEEQSEPDFHELICEFLGRLSKINCAPFHWDLRAITGIPDD